MRTSNVTFKIALPIIIIGIFTIVVFIALGANKPDLGFYIVVLILSVFIFLFGFATGQDRALPVKKLLKRATDLSKGDLTTRVYLETKDEFGELAQIFNKIAEELEESHSKAEKTEKSVDIKVRAKTQDLEETINALDQKVRNRTIELERIVNESDKLKEDVKNKEKEALDFKAELGQLKEKLGISEIKEEKVDNKPAS
ncbi:MAG: HAMP domain-containing protein [bacterium]|nr:HAMP domain-containing protein [bacterium]